MIDSGGGIQGDHARAEYREACDRNDGPVIDRTPYKKKQCDRTQDQAKRVRSDIDALFGRRIKSDAGGLVHDVQSLAQRPRAS